jgi:hypothetical protein
VKRWLMAFFGLKGKTLVRMKSLEQRGQLAVDRADEAAARAHRIAQADERVRRESQQYTERLNDRRMKL